MRKNLRTPLSLDPLLSHMQKSLISRLTVLGLLAAFTSPALAAEPKRVIVCTVTTGYRHSSIPHAEKTLEELSKETQAYTIVDFARQPSIEVPKKPSKPRDLKADADEKAKTKHAEEMKKYEDAVAKWTPEMEEKFKAAEAEKQKQIKESLAKLAPAALKENKIDAVIFANTTGDLPLPDKEGFIAWIKEGHAFLGMHSASDTFHGYPEFIKMIGGEFDGHGAQVPAELIRADASHPATQTQPDPWNIAQEEMYLIKNHDRSALRALWFMRHHPNKKDVAGYFPVSWCKKFGNGRVFYTSLGHREDLWSNDPAMKDRKNSVEISNQYRAHLIGGIKWALGLAEGSAEPNPEAK